jgi:hypothetical protein
MITPRKTINKLTNMGYTWFSTKPKLIIKNLIVEIPK